MWISEYSEAADRTWYYQLKEAIQTLEQFPERCPVAPESGHRNTEIRQLLFGKRRGQLRILFTIRSNSVRVLHARRSVRPFLTSEELGLP